LLKTQNKKVGKFVLSPLIKYRENSLFSQDFVLLLDGGDEQLVILLIRVQI